MKTRPDSEDMVLTKRIINILNKIEKMSGHSKQRIATYKKSYRIPTEKDKREIMYIEKKVKAIYSSNEKDNKCISSISPKKVNIYGDNWYKWDWLPLVEYEPDSDNYRGYGLGIDTKLKYAMLANVGCETCFEYITQNSEIIQEYENEIKRIREENEMIANELGKKQENSSIITFSSIKNAIKEKLLGKGERD